MLVQCTDVKNMHENAIAERQMEVAGDGCRRLDATMQQSMLNDGERAAEQATHLRRHCHTKLFK